MAIFNSYVKLPEGSYHGFYTSTNIPRGGGSTSTLLAFVQEQPILVLKKRHLSLKNESLTAQQPNPVCVPALVLICLFSYIFIYIYIQIHIYILIIIIINYYYYCYYFFIIYIYTYYYIYLEPVCSLFWGMDMYYGSVFMAYPKYAPLLKKRVFDVLGFFNDF